MSFFLIYSQLFVISMQKNMLRAHPPGAILI